MGAVPPIIVPLSMDTEDMEDMGMGDMDTEGTAIP